MLYTSNFDSSKAKQPIVSGEGCAPQIEVNHWVQPLSQKILDPPLTNLGIYTIYVGDHLRQGWTIYIAAITC